MRRVFFCFLIWAPQGGAGGHCISIFSIEIQTADRYWWNLASRWSLRVRRFLGGFNTVPPPTPPPGTGCIKGVQGVSGASAVHFGKNFIKQKLQGAPDLVGVGHLFGPQIRIWKDLGPMSFWRHGHSLWRVLDKTNVVVYVPNSYLVRLDTLYPDPESKGGPKGGPVGFRSLRGAFWQKLYKTKVTGHPQYSGSRTLLWMPNPYLEGPGPVVCFWGCVASLSRRVYNTIVVVLVLNRPF